MSAPLRGCSRILPTKRCRPGRNPLFVRGKRVIGRREASVSSWERECGYLLQKFCGGKREIGDR